jgi:hypothetical protein
MTSLLSEFGYRLKEYALETKNELSKSESEADKLFYEGKLLACHNIISMLQNDARIAEIPLEMLQLQNFDPNKDLG